MRNPRQRSEMICLRLHSTEARGLGEGQPFWRPTPLHTACPTRQRTPPWGSLDPKGSQSLSVCSQPPSRSAFSAGLPPRARALPAPVSSVPLTTPLLRGPARNGCVICPRSPSSSRVESGLEPDKFRVLPTPSRPRGRLRPNSEELSAPFQTSCPTFSHFSWPAAWEGGELGPHVTSGGWGTGRGAGMPRL